MDNFQDAIVTVMGLGRYTQGGGLGATKWLLRHGAQIVITDLKDAAELKESVDLVMEWYEKYRAQFPNRTIYQPLFILGKHRKEDFVNVDCVVQSPGVPSEADVAAEARQKGIAIESDVSLFFRYYPHPIVAVTGTRMKTTTTILIGEMLKALDPGVAVAGNVKVSPLELLDDLLMKSTPTPVVIELSSWLLESMPGAFQDMKKGPDIAVLTNAYPGHLGNRYKTFEEYVRSKEIMFANQTPEQFAVINWDNEAVRAIGETVKSKLFWCSRTWQDHDGCYVKDGNVVFRRAGADTVVIPTSQLGLKDEASMENVLTSACAALLRGVPVDGVAKVLAAFTGLSEGRELVREVDEISYINDTVASAPDAAAASLRAFGGKKDVVLVAGGDDAKLDFAPLLAAVAETCKHVVLLPGSGTDKVEEGLTGTVSMERAMTMEDAVKKARAVAVKGGVVLLSPGALPTGDLFRNEFDRGEQFRDAVRTL